MNYVNRAIHFTMLFSEKEILFLDDLTKRGRSGIWMHSHHRLIQNDSILQKSPKTLIKNILFVMAGLICTLVENNCQKQIFERATEGFQKPQLSWWNWLNWIRKELKIPQAELRQPKTIENNKNITFIRTSNPNNPTIFELLKFGVNALLKKNVNGFEYVELIHTK